MWIWIRVERGWDGNYGMMDHDMDDIRIGREMGVDG
jgi:hypothetical protein